MITWVYRHLPGPLAVRLVLALMLLVVVLVGLHFFYTWLGDSFLDTGGSVG
ncbi:MAG: hypothetical protein OEM94_04655 [Acidimicrobiia bacterium]|nr:hypothetical protein [Acidimicrobiia bacterium]